MIHWENGDWDWVFGEGLEGKLEEMGLGELAWLMGEAEGDDNEVKREKKRGNSIFYVLRRIGIGQLATTKKQK